MKIFRNWNYEIYAIAKLIKVFNVMESLQRLEVCNVYDCLCRNVCEPVMKCCMILNSEILNLALKNSSLSLKSENSNTTM